jgi:hypothetical protein
MYKTVPESAKTYFGELASTEHELNSLEISRTQPFIFALCAVVVDVNKHP